MFIATVDPQPLGRLIKTVALVYHADRVWVIRLSNPNVATGFRSSLFLKGLWASSF
ncbi:MAG TPA: hypothetical protein VN414_00090 [Methanosarcina sp.]|nr:hypothetical protein [Methanosarcina sp.]